MLQDLNKSKYKGIGVLQSGILPKTEIDSRTFLERSTGLWLALNNLFLRKGLREFAVSNHN